jgi:hypothetical protein
LRRTANPSVTIRDQLITFGMVNQPAPTIGRHVIPASVRPCDTCEALQGLTDILPLFGQLLDDADREINSPNVAPTDQWNAPPQSTQSEVQARRAPDVSDDLSTKDSGTPGSSSADADDADERPTTDDPPLSDDEKNDCQKAIDDWIPKYVRNLQSYLLSLTKGYGPFRSFLSAEKYASKTGEQTKGFASRCWKYAQDQLGAAAQHALDHPQ